MTEERESFKPKQPQAKLCLSIGSRGNVCVRCKRTQPHLVSSFTLLQSFTQNIAYLTAFFSKRQLVVNLLKVLKQRILDQFLYFCLFLFQ